MGCRLGLWNLTLSPGNKVKVAQSCPTLYDPMDCNPPGSYVHRISQARILEWVAIPFSRGSSQPRDQTQVSCIADGFFFLYQRDTREAQKPPRVESNSSGRKILLPHVRIGCRALTFLLSRKLKSSEIP